MKLLLLTIALLSSLKPKVEIHYYNDPIFLISFDTIRKYHITEIKKIVNAAAFSVKRNQVVALRNYKFQKDGSIVLYSSPANASIEVDCRNRILSIRENEHKDIYSYDSIGSTCTIKHYNNRDTSGLFDQESRTKIVRGDTTWFIMQNEVGADTTTFIVFANKVKKIYKGNSLITQFQYDDDGELVEAKDYSYSSKRYTGDYGLKSYTKLPNGDCKEEIYTIKKQQDGTEKKALDVINIYNEHETLVETSAQYENGEYVQKYTYDNSGKLLEEEAFYNSLVYKITYTYNAYNLLARETKVDSTGQMLYRLSYAYKFK